ncbi:hypothetical protein L596_025856 [Steinernema carpocapsae]|uniref:Uncharacterized protein n=1 Tax=Steinernema carpocapsae TaxID=34508 RepID=A0A4U5M902_STECR|nr:hypothetical protein L596_025856 [Steinernema carpocapsae]
MAVAYDGIGVIASGPLNDLSNSLFYLTRTLPYCAVLKPLAVSRHSDARIVISAFENKHDPCAQKTTKNASVSKTKKR